MFAEKVAIARYQGVGLLKKEQSYYISVEIEINLLKGT